MKLHVSKEADLPTAVITSRVGIFGQSDSGKTYTGMRLAEEMLRAKAQVIAIDPVGPWYGLRIGTRKHPGFPIHIFGGIHGDLPLTPESGAIVAEVLATKRVSAVLDVSDFTIGQLHRFIGAFSETFFDFKKRNPSPVHLFWEEAHMFLPQKLPPDPGAALMLSRADRVIRVGRNYGVGNTLISQRPQDVAASARNQIAVLFAMYCQGKHERAAINDWFSDKASREAMDLLEELPKLETGFAILAASRPLRIFQKVAVTERLTRDTSSTPEHGEKSKRAAKLSMVDAQALKASMASIAAEVGKTDVRALQKRVAELEEQVKKQKVKVEIREVPIITKRDLKLLGAAMRRVSRAEEALVAFKKGIDEAVSRVLKAGAGNDALESSAKDVVRSFKASANGARDAFEAASGAGDERPYHRVEEPLPPLPPKEGAGQIVATLNKGERAILTAAAQHKIVSREQLTVLTGYKRSSRDTYLQRLKAAGCVSQIDATGAVQITSHGIASLGPFTPLPTGSALREHWLRELPEGERKILNVVVGQHPVPTLKASIDTLTGYKRSSRDTYLQRLAARNLVVVDRVQVAASAALFDRGAP